MAQLEIVQLPALADNYVYLLHEPTSGDAAVVDPSNARVALDALCGRKLTHVLATHHHWDHSGGNVELVQQTGCVVVGSSADAHAIPAIGIQVTDGDVVRVGAAEGRVLAIPGHTLGHVAYYFPESRALFCGDTLFSLGCGRVFEGSPEQMWASLDRLRSLPDDTLVYCGHEYTQTNAAFAVLVEPENERLRARRDEVAALRSKRLPTVPTTLAEERATNPFLRPESPQIRDHLGLPDASDVQVFAELRRRKDRF